MIGDNTIIGAYSVVSGKVEANSVYAGNPARKICSILEYYEKIKNRQVDDACEIYRHYKNNFKKQPPIEIFHEYFYLFSDRDDDFLPDIFEKKFRDHGNYEETVKYFQKHTPEFLSYEEFCKYAELKMREGN